MEKAILALVLLTSGIQAVNAEEPNISEGKILEIRVKKGIIRVVQENANYPEGCDPAAAYFTLPTTEEGDLKFLPPLLTAYQSGRDVRLTISPCVRGTSQITEIILH